MRFPTFTSRQMYSLQHSMVVDGIAKADLYAELLTSAKNVAMGLEQKGNLAGSGNDHARHKNDTILH